MECEMTREHMPLTNRHVNKTSKWPNSLSQKRKLQGIIESPGVPLELQARNWDSSLLELMGSLLKTRLACSGL
jgi:hypothetical protein